MFEAARARARKKGVEQVCILCEGPDGDHAACDRDGGWLHQEGPDQCACWALNHEQP
jgi:hypothetical protein